MLKTELLSDEEIEQEVISIDRMLSHVESVSGFCKAHELVNRHRITQKSIKIEKAIRQRELKPFQFLLNKN